MTYQLEQISLVRSRVPIVQDVSLCLRRRRITGVLGANGAGKSTLLAALSGELPPASGKIFIDQKDLQSMLPDELARIRATLTAGVQPVFNLTVRQVLELGLYSFSDLCAKQKAELTERAISYTEVQQWMDSPVSVRSLGEQQRIHFARVLVQAEAGLALNGNGWLLLDEPTANLDPHYQQQLMSVCQKLARDQDLGVVVVMHDLTLALQWCDDVVVLKDGAVLASGLAQDIITPTVIQAMYGSIDAHVITHPVKGVVISRKSNDN